MDLTVTIGALLGPTGSNATRSVTASTIPPATMLLVIANVRLVGPGPVVKKHPMSRLQWFRRLL